MGVGLFVECRCCEHILGHYRSAKNNGPWNLSLGYSYRSAKNIGPWNLSFEIYLSNLKDCVCVGGCRCGEHILGHYRSAKKCWLRPQKPQV